MICEEISKAYSNSLEEKGKEEPGEGQESQAEAEAKAEGQAEE